MKDKLYFTEKSQIANEILAYLAEHPEAQDTFEGILQWWLLEQKIKYQMAVVKEAIAELVEEGFLIEDKKRNSQTHYRINQGKYEEIRTILKQDFGDIKKSKSVK